MSSRRRFIGMLTSAPFWGVGCARQGQSSALKAGDPMPALALPMLNGQDYPLAPTAGPFLLNFWATWCLPCRAEMAALERAHRTLGMRGLRIVGISVDSDAYLVDEYVLKERLTFPIVLDAGGAVARSRFLVTAYPTSFLVDAAGRLVDVWVGEKDWDSLAIREKLERVL